MRTYNYNWEVKNLVTLFINALNDVIIKRYNDGKLSEDQIHVNFRYSPKTRTLTDLVTLNQHLQLPVISCFITAMRRDQTRVFNNILGSYYNINPLSATGFEHLLQPLPVNITMNVSIIGRFQTDIDQIIDNIMVWFDPYIVVSQEVPFFPQEVRSVIMWNQNISMEYPLDIAANVPYRMVANTSFEIYGWLYKPPQSPTGKIYKIDTSFISVSDIYDNLEYLTGQTTPDNTDFFTISARPQVFRVVPDITITDSYSDFVLIGDMFQFTSGIYLSATPNVFDPSMLRWIDPLSGNYRLSASYPGFSGIPLTSWDIQNEKTILFSIPSAVAEGFIDVIVMNEAGYGALTIDSRRQTFNPYPTALPEYATWTAFQPRWTSGIRVVDPTP